jgi:ankyrin repeat protein
LRAKVSVDCKMIDGWTPFFYAAVNGYLVSVDTLANQGHCNINSMDKFHRTALHWVARYNNKSMVKKLLDLGLNYEIQDTEKLTAYDLAKDHGNYEVAQILF